MRVKVCGLTRREDVVLCVSLGIDALGFIFAESPRQISTEKAAALLEDIPPFISRVAVVQNPGEKLLMDILETGLFDYIQFHGDEERDLLERCPLKTIKSICIEPGQSIRSIEKSIAQYPGADYYLFDNRTGQKRGGTGKNFDWGIFRYLKMDKPFILAGGLGPDNIVEALETIEMAAIDINSRIEKRPGIKDGKLLSKTLELIEGYRRKNLSGK
ncbi:MAG: phosphoribosylanthranilate isomerase [Halanaerobiaceae bacterium]|jgi:phosphoribosylanthranilate isomerase|nr:phosphoribosylanthranilate isomerase [Halanaerobiaceae bacterium]